MQTKKALIERQLMPFWFSILELYLQYRRTEEDRRTKRDRMTEWQKMTEEQKKTEWQKDKKTKTGGDLFCLHGIVTTEYQ